MSHFARLFAYASAFFCLLCAPSFAQQYFAPGYPEFSTQVGSQYDQIDLADSNISITLPLRSINAGPLPLSFMMSGQSNAYSANPFGTGVSWFVTTPSFSLLASVGASRTDTPEPEATTCNGQPDSLYTNFGVVDSFGTVHPLSTIIILDSGGCHPLPSPLAQPTTDGSGYTVVFSGTAQAWQTTVYDKAGNSYSGIGTSVGVVTPDDIAALSVAYPSANTQTETDALTSTPVVTQQSHNGYPPFSYSYPYTNAAGATATATYTVNYTTYTQATNFGCSGIAELGPVPLSFPTSITTPIGTYTITYEVTPNNFTTTKYPPPYYTGRIASITLPSGGSISYTYSGGSNGINCGNKIVPTITRTVNDNNGNVNKWTYVNSNAGGIYYSNFTVVITDPANNQAVYYMQGQFQTQVISYQGGCPTSITGCNGGGTLLKTVTTCYNAVFTKCATPSTITGPPIKNFSQTDVFTSYNGGSNNLIETKFDTYGNPLEVKHYDFAFTSVTAPTGVTPLSDTLTYYGQSWNGTSCTAYPSGVYIYTTPCYSVTNNSAGAAAQTQITYTNTGYPATTKQWTGSAWLPSSAIYTGSGTVSTSTDVSGAVSTYYYNGTDGCNSLLPTSVTVTGAGLPSAGLTTTTQWNCDGAVATQTSDLNGKSTGYTYSDPLWRVTSVTDPLLNATNDSYPTPTTFDTTMSFPSMLNKVRTTDGLSRVIQSQTRTAPGATTFDNTIVYGYGSNTTGAIATQTIPGGTAVTTTQYDAIGRPLSTTDAGGGKVSYTYIKNDVLQSVGPSPTFQKQLEYDGLGRLTRMCEITGVTGSGSCGESNPATGFLTIYSYDALGNLLTVTQNAQPGAVGGTQTRSYSYDGLSRVTSETNPEWGPGTATYTYDTDSICGTSNGDLVKKVDNAVNTSCYSYDGLHRITDVIVYKAGACYPPVKRFRYDNTTNAIVPFPSGYSASNTSGRMIEAWTGDCVWPTPASGFDSATDEWFAYSVRGEMTHLWESTAHILGYYHGTATYAANGALASVGGVSGYTAVTYGVDTEGRLNTATQGTTDLVPAAAFTAGSQLKTISLGNGDQDSYLYDTNTDRMTNYTFTVNGVTDSGTLTWNANGTLGQLLITDKINPGGSQTCIYSGYDDLGRLLGVTCGSKWSQTFSDDPFGNITKTGNSQWMPGYNSATNHALPPFTYDNNGNMTNDTLRTYAWYVDNKLGSINSTTCNIFGSTDGTCILYDAFGREVERGVNGVYTEVMYTPVGKTAVMNGETTTVSAYFPLPGGATYYQTGSTNGSGYFWHKDWLGSVRLSSSVLSRTCYYDRAFAPYGEMYNNFCGNTGGLNFTGDTQDSFAGLLYDTPNRELHPGQGRWLSPDPAGLSVVDPTNPQSWNRYAYVINNPLSNVDPTGLADDCDTPGDCDWTPNDPTSGGEPTMNFPQITAHSQCDSNGENCYIVGDRIGECLPSSGGRVCWDGRQWSAAPGDDGGILSDIANWFRTAKFLGLGGSLWIAHPKYPVGWSPGVNVVSDGTKGRTCISLAAGGVGQKTPGGSFGPLYGNPSQAPAIIQGSSLTINANLPISFLGNPGVQIITGGSAGTIAGPSFGTSGLSLQVSYSWPCTP
jgi:RHS repeat-associated protein